MTDGGEGASGYKYSKEQKDKRSQMLKGRIFSQETKDKISKSRIGQIPWNKGIDWNEETKKKMSENHPKSWIGRTHTDETKLKMSIKASGKNNPMYGVPSPLKGKKHSEETRIKMAESRKKYLEEKRKLNEIRN